jgi:hypothetical protein
MAKGGCVDWMTLRVFHRIPETLTASSELILLIIIPLVLDLTAIEHPFVYG